MLEFWSVILQYSKKNLTAQRFTIISYYFVLLTTGFVFRRFDLIWPEWFYCFPECLTMKHVFRSNLGDDLLEFFFERTRHTEITLLAVINARNLFLSNSIFFMHLTNLCSWMPCCLTFFAGKKYSKSTYDYSQKTPYSLLTGLKFSSDDFHDSFFLFHWKFLLFSN